MIDNHLINSSRSGYEAAAKHFAPADLEVSLSGRSYVITGANSGLGKATAQEVANRGACALEADLKSASSTGGRVWSLSILLTSITDLQ